MGKTKATKKHKRVTRFPDIVVIPWRCDCGEYMSYSVDQANVEVVRLCPKCVQSYVLKIGEVDLPIKIKRGK